MSFWVAGATAVVGIGSAVASSNSARKAANAQERSSQAAIAEQARQYDLARADQAPYRQIGVGALNQLASLYGLPTYAADPNAERFAGAQPASIRLPGVSTPGGALNIGGSLANKIGGIGGALLDPAASLFGSKHGDERRNLKAFASESGVMQLPDGSYIMPDGRTFSANDLQHVAGTWYGATYAPDGDQQGWQARYDQALGGPAQSTGVTIDNDTGMVVNPDGSVSQRIPSNPGASSTPGTPNYNAFFASPDYIFARDQGLEAVQRSAAARGNLFSGNTGAALEQYGQGLASQQLNNYTNRLASLAGVGQTAATATGQFGITTGQGIANNLIDAGNARASGIVGQSNAYSDALGTLGGALGNYFANRGSYTPLGGTAYVPNGLRPIGVDQGLVSMPNIRY